MKKLFLVSLLVFTGCAPVEEEDPFQKQSEVLSNVEELVDFQSSSAVAEWTPSMQKKIDEMFDELLPSVKITGKMEEYDPYKSKNLIGSYKDATIYIPLPNRKPDGNRVILKMNKEYYLATGDQSAIDSIRALSLKMK